MVRAIAGSIMHAQHMVEKAQLANISSFFDGDHKPEMIEVALPALHSTAAPGEHHLYQVPVLSLVPHGSLVIGEAEIDLDVEIGAFEHHERDNAHPGLVDQMGRAAPAERKAGLMVNPAAGALASRHGNAAHIKLRLVAVDKSEGLARLLNDVVKTQGPAAAPAHPAAPAAAHAPAPAAMPPAAPAPAHPVAHPASAPSATPPAGDHRGSR